MFLLITDRFSTRWIVFLFEFEFFFLFVWFYHRECYAAKEWVWLGFSWLKIFLFYRLFDWISDYGVSDTTVMYSTEFFLPCLVHWFYIKRSAVFANDGFHGFSLLIAFWFEVFYCSSTTARAGNPKRLNSNGRFIKKEKSLCAISVDIKKSANENTRTARNLMLQEAVSW